MTTSRGFSSLITLLIVAVLIIVVAGGYVTWRGGTSEAPLKELVGSKSFKTSDIFWDYEVRVEGRSLVWKNGSTPIKDPATIEYVGLGIFRDSGGLYSMGYIRRHYDDAISLDVEDLDASQPITILQSKEGWEKYLINGNKVYALVSEMSLPWLELVPTADAKSFKLVDGSDYATDSISVYYAAQKLEGADPKNFTAREVSDANGSVLLGFSGEKVYYDHLLLEGVSSSGLVVEKYGNVVRDSDTAWFATGNCDFKSFKKGVMSDIPSYEPPC